MRKIKLSPAIILLILLIATILPIAVYAAASTSTPLDLSRTATVPTYVQTVSDGVEFANNGRVLLIVRSAETTATTTIVITTTATQDGYAVADATFTLAAGKSKIMGPFPPRTFNDSSGNVTVVAANVVEAGMAVSVTTVRY